MARACAYSPAGAIADGVDPNIVLLIYSDTLYSISVVVARNAFVLRRSRQRTLLLSL
jgi:hypothetical protein